MHNIIVLQHEECEHLGVLADHLALYGVDYKYVKLHESESIPDSGNYSGIIILGGPMSVYDEKEYPFLKQEDSLIKSELKLGTPLLGICLGAQLIAKAAGAKVTHGKHKEIGWYPLHLTAEGRMDKIFYGLKERMTVFQWHGDTFDIPKDSIRLASSDIFPNQAFLIGTTAYALQFHLEVSISMIENWMKRYHDELSSLKGEIDAGRIHKDSKKLIKALNLNASYLCENFIRLLN